MWRWKRDTFRTGRRDKWQTDRERQIEGEHNKWEGKRERDGLRMQGGAKGEEAD